MSLRALARNLACMSPRLPGAREQRPSSPPRPRRALFVVGVLAAALCTGAAPMSEAMLAAAEVTPRRSVQRQEDARMRARDMGVVTGTLDPGPFNAITDVPGVRVGHTTLHEGDRFRTGVTAVVPHGGNLFRDKVPAAIVVGNGFGKLAGLSQVQELGTLETPILLTGTLSVPRVADALITYMLELPGNEDVRSINPVVGETNDGRLSDIRARPIRPEHVFHAIRSAREGQVLEGAVGAGTGTVAFGFKGGIGTSSRRTAEGAGGWTVGVLVQTNFGGRRSLRISGVPVGEELATRAAGRGISVAGSGDTSNALAADLVESDTAPGDGSCMIVVATDAPLEHRALERLALRALMGMARTGSNFSNGSGDYVIAFSTHTALRTGAEADAQNVVRTLPSGALSPLFQAVIEATEEAIYNSLFMAQTTEGFRGTRVEALPLDRVRNILQRHRALR